MRLVNARLCLDCDELHDQSHCPICGSETFAFVTRWVKPAEGAAGEPLGRPTRQSAGADRSDLRDSDVRPEQIDAYKQILEPRSSDRRNSMMRRGAIGLALIGLARMAWKSAPDPKRDQ